MFIKRLFSNNHTPSTADRQGILLTDRLGFTFQNVAILENITFQVKPGERWTVLGNNGAGKTTLGQLLCGLLTPTGGQVSLAGQPLEAGSGEIGLLFQFAEMQFFQPTIEQELSYPLKQRGVSKDRLKFLIRESLDQLELKLEDIHQRSPFELSAGEQRRLAIACLLMLNPQILILDEPFSGLDGRGKKVVLNSILRLNQEKGISLIVVSHSPATVYSWVSNWLILHKGQQIFCGTAESALAQPHILSQAGLRPPSVTPSFL